MSLLNHRIFLYISQCLYYQRTSYYDRHSGRVEIIVISSIVTRTTYGNPTLSFIMFKNGQTYFKAYLNISQHYERKS